MPNVAGKKYAYTKKGMAEAKKASEKTGKKMNFGKYGKKNK
mgnify:CR=1 FL=1